MRKDIGALWRPHQINKPAKFKQKPKAFAPPLPTEDHVCQLDLKGELEVVFFSSFSCMV